MLLTAWTHLETAVELVKAGAADYLAKPWDNTRLVTTVRNLLQLRAALQEAGSGASVRTAQSRAALAARFDLRGVDLRERCDARRPADRDAGRTRRRCRC